MPYFYLPPEEIKFPPGHFADLDGLLGQGGDISSDWLLEGYRSGVYLWASPMEPLKWYSPDPRLVIFPDELDIEFFKNVDGNYEISAAFDLESCLDLSERMENAKTMYPGWVTAAFRKAYRQLESEGYADGIGILQGDELVGCAFGCKIGRVFCCEYISGVDEEAALKALWGLIVKLKQAGVRMIDIHKETNATKDIGIDEISRSEYLDLLKKWQKP